MALIVITVPDGPDGVAIGVQAEPAPRVISRVPPTPAQVVASAMLNAAQAAQQPAANASGIIVPH